MSRTDSSINRREWLSGWWRPSSTEETATPVPLRLKESYDETTDDLPQVAVIQGRFCLAYRNLVCTSCIERCPVAGAIVLESNMPQVNPDLCTGCGECQEVCPAPRNAILAIPRRSPLPSPAVDP